MDCKRFVAGSILLEHMPFSDVVEKPVSFSPILLFFLHAINISANMKIIIVEPYCITEGQEREEEEYLMIAPSLRLFQSFE